MPGRVLPAVPHYEPAPPTKEELDYAQLPILDLSKAQTLEGRKELASQACEAIAKNGFFYVINHGYTPAETARIFDIADVPFSQVEDEEKLKYVGNGDTGVYQGYKMRKYWHIKGGVQDQVEHYASHCNVYNREHPDALKPLVPELDEFAAHNHLNVLHPIMRILALGLELPEDTLVELHGFKTGAETSVRFMKYYPRTADDEEKTDGVWLKGHTDIGSLTILWSQPVSALQILSHDGKWRWIKHIPNALVINAGDALEFLSGGFYKATIHRVVQPPVDQRGYTRVGAYYFCFPENDQKLVPYTNESPVLKRLGQVKKMWEEGQEPTTAEWRSARTKSYGRVELKEGKEKGVEEEIVNGVVVKHWN